MILAKPREGDVDKINEILIFKLLIEHGAWIYMTYGGKLVFFSVFKLFIVISTTLEFFHKKLNHVLNF